MKALTVCEYEWLIDQLLSATQLQNKNDIIIALLYARHRVYIVIVVFESFSYLEMIGMNKWSLTYSHLICIAEDKKVGNKYWVYT